MEDGILTVNDSDYAGWGVALPSFFLHRAGEADDGERADYYLGDVTQGSAGAGPGLSSAGAYVACDSFGWRAGNTCWFVVKSSAIRGSRGCSTP